MGVNPHFSLLTDEAMHHRTCNNEDRVCLDIKAQGLWGSNVHKVFVRIYHNQFLPASYQRHAQAGKKKKEEESL